jgi:hypothetical protein
MTIENLLHLITSYNNKQLYFISVGCGSNENLDKDCIHQQYPTWFRSIEADKVIILIDPLLEDNLKLDLYLSKQIYKDIIKLSDNLYSATDHFDNNITIITSKCYFDIDDNDELPDNLIKLGSNHFKEIITHVLNTESKLFIQSFTGYSYYKYQKSFSEFFPKDLSNNKDSFYDNIIFDCKYDYDGDCYPDLNSGIIFTDDNKIFNIDRYNKEDNIMKLLINEDNKQDLINKHIIKQIKRFFNNDLQHLRKLINKFFTNDLNFDDISSNDNIYIPIDILNFIKHDKDELLYFIKSIIYENIDKNVLIYIKDDSKTKQLLNEIINKLLDDKNNIYNLYNSFNKILIDSYDINLSS